MMTQTGIDRSHESVINDTLARIFRDRLGFSAVAETLLHGKRPDIIVRLSASRSRHSSRSSSNPPGPCKPTPSLGSAWK